MGLMTLFAALGLMTLLVLVPACGGAEPRSPAGCAGCYRPKPSTASWQTQFQDPIDPSVRARFFDIDGDYPAKTVRALQRRGRKVACYLNAGAWEDFRADSDAYPRSVRGAVYEDYADDERWLDIRRIDLLAPILRARINACRAKGFDGVDPDNLNGFETKTGFPLSADDQLRFNKWLAKEVHARGLSIGLKNDGTQARALEPHFDWVIVEECIEQGNCGEYAPFTRAGKAIFAIEYLKPTRRVCQEARRRRISLVFKKPDLTAPRRTCADVRG
jgi:hypothetical protein